MSTRPRISFDDRGWCNACSWMEEKTSLDFSKRQAELDIELERVKSLGNEFDCFVPVSGDQDGTGFGYDKNLIKAVENNKLLLIIAGGVGNYLHLISALKNEKIYAATTANLFNFMGKGLAEARQKLIEENLNISK